MHALEEPPAGWDGEHGYVARAVLERHLPPQRHGLQYFVCSPPAMIAVVEEALYQMGIGMNQSHTELLDLVFARIQAGLSIALSAITFAVVVHADQIKTIEQGKEG